MRKATIKIWVVVILLTVGIVNVSFAGLSESKLVFYSPSQASQTSEIETEDIEAEPKEDHLGEFLSDTQNILTSPLRWEKSDYIKASIFAGITAGLYACDADIQDWTQRNRNNTSDDIAEFAKPFGDGSYILPSLGAFYLYGHFFEDKKAQRTAWMGFESFAFSGIFTQALKFSTHRHRPSTGDSYSTWDGPSFSTSHLSFPSGHASSAFSIATVIATEYDDIVFVPPLAYTMATLTAISRVNDDDHWASDVFLGSAIGYFTAKAVIDMHNSKGDGNLTIQPMVNGEFAGLFAVYKF